jgi:hypothetical protein
VGLWDVTLGYTGLRTAVTLLRGLWEARRGVPFGPVACQAGSDLASAGVLTACIDYRVREALGLWALPLTGYVLLWECGLRIYIAVHFTPTDADEPASQADWLGGWMLVVWRIVIVLPAIGAALLLAFNVLYPNALRLPSERPPILCEPVVVRGGDTLVIEMTTPHGGELTVTNPLGTTLVVVPFAAASVPIAQRFERQPVLRLPVDQTRGQLMAADRTERVFQDSGTYVFQVTAIPDVAGSLVCRTRFITAVAATPPPPR